MIVILNKITAEQSVATITDGYHQRCNIIVSSISIIVILIIWQHFVVSTTTSKVAVSKLLALIIYNTRI